MADDLLRLDSVLSLTAEEGEGVVIPQSEWEKGSGGFRLTLLGRLLSYRSVNFDALKDSLINIFQASPGVVVRKVSESRFCPIFYHFEDLRRMFELRPWIFYRNLVIIQSSPTADPLSVDLNWCPFFVHIHYLPYGQCIVVVVRYIGECLGAWLDGEDISRHISWYESVRIRININIAVPLKRALHLRSECGDELCDLRFQDQFVDPGTKTPYGAWLRAYGPMRRIGSVSSSVQPTYIWRDASSSGTAGIHRRGVHIFGDFRQDSIEPSRLELVVEGDPVGFPSLRERFAAVQEQLDWLFGKEKSVQGRQLVDQNSESHGLQFLETIGFGPGNNQINRTHIRLAQSTLEDSVGSSLGPVDVQPKIVANPSFGSHPSQTGNQSSPAIELSDSCPRKLSAGGPSRRAISLSRSASLVDGDEVIVR
ncbi:hypothetical protein Salat_1934700 [Sesamum alatum]|uniref:DUF4283 domain-containing protein n=1 Tax=Sesamum alatum TaxID=300844 RepID=A0AAE1Y4D9_9LAMI|nr:hypothetical protein Salat_1934700 [Sesamum alatum]